MDWDPRHSFMGDGKGAAMVGNGNPMGYGFGSGGNFDASQSSLFTGKGTPWGAKENNAPGDPNYMTDPNQMGGYDYSGMRKSMEQGLRLQRARSDVNTKQSLSHANPYGASSETGKALGQSGADTEANINQGNMQIDRQAYNEKVQAMNTYNQNLQNQYKIQQDKSDKEDKQRQGFMDKGSSILTAGLGG